MEEVISKIIEVNNKLFGNNQTTERINVILLLLKYVQI